MKATIGRIVIYKTSESDKEVMRANHSNVQDFLPAMIVKAWSDTCVNLKVFLDGIGEIWKTSVPLGDQENNWNWPEISQ
jgi:hypothetical protein